MSEQGALWVAGALLVLRTPWWPIGIVLIGIVYARNLEFMHECLHASALPEPRDNAFFGRLLGLPMLVSFSRWRREHMLHHANVRVEGFSYEYERLTNWREYLIHSLMMRHFADALRRMARLDPEYRLLVLTVVLATFATIVFRSPVLLLLWLAPLPVAAIVHTHIELPEHFGLSGNEPLKNSRVIPGGRLLTWFVNANNYHAIHHWRPRLPTAALPAEYAAIASQVQTSTYVSFYREFYRGLGRHNRTSGNAG